MDFKKTYIYIKTCEHCGLKYVGKSINYTDKNNYKGSGERWLNHLKKYKAKIKTFIIREFNENQRQECIDFCLWFSRVNNIVKSKKWANLRYENGIDGCLGHTEETKKKISETKKGSIPWNKGKKGVYSEELLKKMSEASKGRKMSEEAKKKMSIAHKGQTSWLKGKKWNEKMRKKMQGKPKKGSLSKTKYNTYQFRYKLNGKRKGKSFKTLEEAQIAQKIYMGAYEILEKYYS